MRSDSNLVCRLNSQDAGFAEALDAILRRDDKNAEVDEQIEQSVRNTIRQVREGGDAALIALTKKYDHFDLASAGMEVPTQRLQTALQSISTEQQESLQFAAKRIRQFHQHQLQQSWHYQEQDGTQLGQKITAIKRVGVYVPGGKAAYPSSVLMNVIPAKVAGVDELIMASPTPGGELNELVLAAAYIAGVDKVLRIGGAQAIAALAYGTETIAAVDKITGPGNVYVAAAKKQVFGKVGIDMIAGPSEVLVIADETVDPDWIAMDMFAQAEHDQLAQSILLTQNEAVADRVQTAINKLLPDMPRKAIIALSLGKNGAIIVAHDETELIEIANHIAPEHLEIFTENADQLAQQINNAGAIFIGPYSSESLGDYCAGPNHVLPTSGTARFSSPLGVYDFQKRSSMLRVSKAGAQELGKHAAVLARGESLIAHAIAADFRRDK